MPFGFYATLANLIKHPHMICMDSRQHDYCTYHPQKDIISNNLIHKKIRNMEALGVQYTHHFFLVWDAQTTGKFYFLKVLFLLQFSNPWQSLSYLLSWKYGCGMNITMGWHFFEGAVFMFLNVKQTQSKNQNALRFTHQILKSFKSHEKNETKFIKCLFFQSKE